MMSTPTFLPHSSPIVHRPEVKEVVERKYLLNKDSLSFHVYLSPFHPCPLAMMFFACAREGWGERERSPFGMPPERPRSRHVGPRSNISREAEQPSEHTPAGHQSRNVKPGKVGKMRNGDVNGSFPTTYAEDRDGNSRASSFCLFSRRTRRQVPQE